MRTNFIEGCNGADVVFDQFVIPRSALEKDGALSGKVTFSVRPQSMRLLRARPAAADGPGVAVKVVERAYLGDFWNYVVCPARARPASR